MKHPLATIPVLLCCLNTVSLTAEEPQAILKSITKVRGDRLAEAKAQNKRADFTAINTEVQAKARTAVKDIDPSKVELAAAQPWTELFMQAQDYKGARTVAERWAAKASGEEKFKAQMALMAADFRLKDMKSVAGTLVNTKAASAQGGIRLATLANSYVLPILTDADKEAALSVLAAGEAAVPKDGFADDKERTQAKLAAENLAKTRKLMADNPGEEAQALEADRRARITQLLGGRGSGTSTNAAAAAAAARKARDEKFAKFISQPATDFKATQAIGEYNGVNALKGKVVVLDFFAHWCGPCIASLPAMRQLYDDLQAKGLRIVGVTRFYGYFKKEKNLSVEKELERMKAFVPEKNITWPVAFVGKDVFEAYGCSAIPHVVVIDRQGRVHTIKVGYSKNEVEAFHKEIEKLLAG